MHWITHGQLAVKPFYGSGAVPYVDAGLCEIVGLSEIAGCAAFASHGVAGAEVQPCAFWMAATLDHLEAHRFLQ